MKAGRWARNKMLRGHELFADDLMDEYVNCLREELYDLQQQAAPLTAEQADWAKRLANRLGALEKAHNLRQHRSRVVFRTGFQQLTPGNVMPLTPAESELICLLTWQSFDWRLHFLTTASAEQLKEFVAEPEKWQANLPGTAIFARDAVPVYLDAATGKLLVSAGRLNSLCERRAALAYAKKKGLPRAEAQEVVLTSDAQGASRQDKNRSTWICRQGLFGLWACRTATRSQ